MKKIPAGTVVIETFEGCPVVKNKANKIFVF